MLGSTALSGQDENGAGQDDGGRTLVCTGDQVRASTRWVREGDGVNRSPKY